MKAKEIKVILIIAPHQDDESIGCGGLIAKLRAKNHPVYVQHIFGGYTNVLGKTCADSAETRLLESQHCSNILDFTLLENFGFIDREYDSIGAIINKLISLFHEIQPDVVLCPHQNEGDYEHRIVHSACKEALWLSKIEGFKEYKTHNRKASLLICYEIWTPILSPIFYVNIENFVSLKKRAIQAHESQLANRNWVDGITGLNTYRGATVQGKSVLEAYETSQLVEEQVKILNAILSQ